MTYCHKWIRGILQVSNQRSNKRAMELLIKTVERVLLAIIGIATIFATGQEVYAL